MHFILGCFQVVYSDDDEVACTNFTRDFYRLVNIKSESNRSLHSPAPPDGTTASSSDENERTTSPTPSEAGQAQVHSCSSSESSDVITEKLDPSFSTSPHKLPAATTDLLQDVLIIRHNQQQQQQRKNNSKDRVDKPSATWRRSSGWRRVPKSNHVSIFYYIFNLSLVNPINIILFRRRTSQFRYT